MDRARASLGRRVIAAVRALSLAIAAPLSDADATIQPMPDASPAKWHLAHTTWFFETFVLRDHVAGLSRRSTSAGPICSTPIMRARASATRAPRRGMLSRPSLDEVRRLARPCRRGAARRCHRLSMRPPTLVELGLNHEQQHQELMLMDMLADLRRKSAAPGASGSRAGRAGRAGRRRRSAGSTAPAASSRSAMTGAGFAFDCEGPRHQVLLHPHALADRPVTNAEWLGFIADGGYADPRLWLSDGWAWVREQRDRGAALLARGRATAGPASGSTACSRSTPPSRSAISAITRPTPLPAGPAPGCRPRRNGRPPPPALDPERRQSARRGRPGPARASPTAAASRHVRRRLGMDGQRLPSLSRLPPGRGRGRRI